MSDTKIPYDEQLDLFAFFELLWKGKIAIIFLAIVAACLSLAFSILMPNSYNVTISLNTAQDPAFTRFIAYNEIIQANKFEYAINYESVLQDFASEFQDYEEIIEILNESASVKNILSNIDDADEREEELLFLANQFKLNVPVEETDLWSLSVEWQDDKEGAALIIEIIDRVLISVHDKIITEIDTLQTNVSVRNASLTKKLTADLAALEAAISFKTDEQLRFLKQQAEIAQELGIETNRIGDNSNSLDIPSYQRGFEEINEEIALLSSSPKINLLALDDVYVNIKSKLFVLKNSVAAQQILSVKESMALEDPSGWVRFNIASAQFRSSKQPVLYVVLGLLLGGTLGAIYVLLSNIGTKRKIKSL